MPTIQPILRTGRISTTHIIQRGSKFLAKQEEKINDAVKNTDIIKQLPIVAVPIIAYNVNAKKLEAESGKIYTPYTDAVESSKKEFSSRGLPWNDNYANSNTGYLDPQGRNIIRRYDEAKAYFKDNGLDFSNSYINSQTGTLNQQGLTIRKNCEHVKELFEQNNVPFRTSYLDKKTGRMSSYHEKQFGFRGGDGMTYPEADLSSGESIGIPPEIYDDTAVSVANDIKEIEALNKAIEGLDTLLNDPALIIAGAALAAEVTPFVRFIKPAVDLAKGDPEKASIGIATRVVDLGLSPIKLMAAATIGITDAIIGNAFNDKESTFINGFKNFYKDWINGRDSIEDELIGRESKIQKREKLEKEIAKLAAEREKKIAERKRKEEELQKRIEQQREKLEKIKTIQDQEIQYQENLVELGKGDLSLGMEREEFGKLLEQYIQIKPNADISKFANYTNWNRKKLSINAKVIKREMQKKVCRQAQGADKKNMYSLYNTCERNLDKSLTENYRKDFVVLLNEYQALKPDAKISQFAGWQNWHHRRLKANIDHLQRTIETIKRKMV